eukprot:1157079-Pelagomonas_calceolata.AAC.9
MPTFWRQQSHLKTILRGGLNKKDGPKTQERRLLLDKASSLKPSSHQDSHATSLYSMHHHPALPPPSPDPLHPTHQHVLPLYESVDRNANMFQKQITILMHTLGSKLQAACGCEWHMQGMVSIRQPEPLATIILAASSSNAADGQTSAPFQRCYMHGLSSNAHSTSPTLSKQLFTLAATGCRRRPYDS